MTHLRDSDADRRSTVADRGVHRSEDESRAALLRTKELERENAQLRQAVADLVLDNRSLREALQVLAGNDVSPPLC